MSDWRMLRCSALVGALLASVVIARAHMGLWSAIVLCAACFAAGWLFRGKPRHKEPDDGR